jgi:hypothetical protein
MCLDLTRTRNWRDDVLKRCLTSKGNDNVKENDFRVLLKHGKNGEIAVYTPKETVLKGMADRLK